MIFCTVKNVNCCRQALARFQNFDGWKRALAITAHRGGNVGESLKSGAFRVTNP
jgi:hypothetical protein